MKLEPEINEPVNVPDELEAMPAQTHCRDGARALGSLKSNENVQNKKRKKVIEEFQEVHSAKKRERKGKERELNVRHSLESERQR